MAEGVLDGIGVLGELGLDGSVRPVPGVLALVDALRGAGTERVVVPTSDVTEASLVDGMEVRAARSVAELRACLKGRVTPPCDGERDNRGDERYGQPDVAFGVRRVATPATHRRSGCQA